MKRDMDLVRNLLAVTEDADNVITTDFLAVDGFTHEQIIYHVRLLTAHGLIDSHESGDYASPDRIIIEGLTWDGADYLDAIRDARVWEKTKTVIKDSVGSTTLGVIKDTAVRVATGLIAAALGQA